MAYGKGPFTAQNKILPGMYVNVVGEAQSATGMGSRGKAAIALELDWGNDTSDIFKVTAAEFFSNSDKIFGYKFSAPEMAVPRQIFMGATELYVYRLNGESGTAASSVDFATAKYKGVRGNDIKIIVSTNVDNTSAFDVITTLDNMTVDKQIKVTEDTLKDNDYVTFTKGESFTLSAGTKAFSGGANGATVTTANHADFLGKLEAYQVNIVGCISELEGVASSYASWVKAQRDVYGNCIQAVLYNQAADHEGIINVDEGVAVIPWVLGKEAGCALNASLQNIAYDGEAPITKSYTQSELEDAILDGKFVLHRVGDEFRVLADINSLVNPSADKNDEFKYNQVVRVADQLNIDGCAKWNDKYLGKVANNESGRLSFWNDMVSLMNEYVSIGAIEDFDSDDVIVAVGNQRGSVTLTMPIQVATMLEKAYVTIVIQ